MHGLKRIYLGDLEIAVLEYLWTHGDFDAKGVHNALGKARGISHNTIQSTLERLFKKRLLTRQKISHAYIYHAAVSRDELMSRLINNVVKTISKANTDSMLAAFVDIAAHTDESHLDRLEQLINEYRLKRDTKSPS